MSWRRAATIAAKHTPAWPPLSWLLHRPLCLASPKCTSAAAGLQHVRLVSAAAGVPPFTAAPIASDSTSSTTARRVAASCSTNAPVVIAGGGPTGLAAALLLARQGMRSVVLERRREWTDHPQAHLINMRCMEVLRQLGRRTSIADQVVALMPPLDQWRAFVYCTGLAGQVLGTVDHFKGQSTPYQPSISPEPVAHLAQHRLLPLLVEAAAAEPAIELRMGHSVRSLSQTPEAVTAVVDVAPDGNGGGGNLYRMSAQYLVAADGARGDLRQQLGIGMGGPGAIQHLINIHFLSPQLGRLLLDAGRPGMLYFVFNQHAIAVVVAHNLERGEFVAQVPYFPPLQSGAEFTPARCAQVVRQVACRDDLQLEVRTIRPWTMAGRVAHTYHSGRAFLVGDAAHAFPPSGAFGMNTGICDAHNLAWKLAAVLQGRAGEGLLDTYTAERKPLGTANMLLSVANFNEALRVPQMLGLDYQAANLLSDVLAAPALSWLPPNLRRGVLETTMSVGKAAANPIGRLRRSELAAVFERGETLRLQFPKEDLGYLYASGAVCHGPGDAAAVAEYLRPKPRSAPYTPSTLAGARLPHVPIAVQQPGRLLSGGGSNSTDDSSVDRMTSTIDLPAVAGTALLLVLSESQQQGAWEAAAAAAEAATGIPIYPVVITQSAVGTSSNRTAVGGSQRSTVVQDLSGSWLRLRDLPPEGVLLVRPDGHIAWRAGGSMGHLAADLETAVRTVMAQA